MHLPTTFSQDLRESLVEQSWDKAINHLAQNPTNCRAMADWILDTFEAIQFLRSHLDISYRILSVICNECPTAEYFRLEKIYKLFKTRVLLHQENAFKFENVQQEIWKEQNLKLKSLAIKDKRAFIEYCMSKDEDGWTPMHWAASDGNISFFEMLREVDTELFARLMRIRNNLNMSALYLAFNQGQVPILIHFSRKEKQLFERFLEDPQGPAKTTVLFDAVKQGDENFFEIVATKHTEIFVRLIQMKDLSHKTILHWAAFKKRDQMVKQMFRIDSGYCAKLMEMRDQGSYTPIHAAILGKNYPFLDLVQQYFPNIYQKFFITNEEEVMRKIYEATDENEALLLSQITTIGNVELLEVFHKKDPQLFFHYLNHEELDHNTPFTHAIDNRQGVVLEFFNQICPHLYRRYLTVDYLNLICSDMPAKGALVRQYCTEPIASGILFTLLQLYNRNTHGAIQEINANLAKPHAKEFVRALSKSPKILFFLNNQEDVLTAWFEANPAATFLTHDERLELVLQLPPSQIYNTVEEVTVEICESLLANTIYLEGENFEITEVLNLVQAQFGDHLNDDHAVNCCQEYFAHIKPKFLIAAYGSEDTKEVVMNFLHVIPDPLFRVIIPLLEDDDFIKFIQNAHFVKQIPFIGVATCSQKIMYLKNLESPVTEEIVAWKQRIQTLLSRITIGLEATPPIKSVIVQLNNRLKKNWSVGHGHLISLAQNIAVLNQIKKKLHSYERSIRLQELIDTTLNPLIQETIQMLAILEGLRSKIFVDLARHPLLVIEEPPQEFFCPITGDIMVDPVIDKYNNTYERAAITEWITEHQISPLNRQPLTITDLRPNNELKTRIQAFKG